MARAALKPTPTVRTGVPENVTKAEYRDWCDRLLFAVAPGFPVEILPEDTGLILADRFGGEIVREAPLHGLSGARRKALTLRFSRIAARRLTSLADPDLRQALID